MLQTYSLTSFIRSSDVPFHSATLHFTSLFPLFFARSFHPPLAPRTRVAPYLHSALSSHIREAFRPDFLCSPQLCSFNLQLLPSRFGTKRFTHTRQFASFRSVATLAFPPRLPLVCFLFPCDSFTPAYQFRLLPVFSPLNEKPSE